MSHSIIYDYEKWLVGLIDSPSRTFSTIYSDLMGVLFEMPYSSPHELDKNRIADGLALRDEFDAFFGGNLPLEMELSGIECSFLEVFVALCMRYSDEVITDAGDPPVYDAIFTDILGETGLINYQNGRFSHEKVVEVLECIKYTGVVFRVNGCEEMQLWMQIGKFFIGKIG